MTRAKEYEDGVRFVFDQDHEVTRLIRFQMDTERGQVLRCMVQFEVEYQGKAYGIVRFDDAHGGFHRHLPGWPAPSVERIPMPDVSPNQRIGYAVSEIKRRYKEWEAAARPPCLRKEE